MRKACKIPVFAAIIFLTGCAPWGYDRDRREQARPGPETGDFSWPTRGREALKFGAKKDGVSLHGLLFRAELGDSVAAARAGSVSYVDGGFRGYGSAVIVRHPDGFSTVYAGNFEILVKPGQEVRRGDEIGRIAGAAHKAAPELYFEIRKDGRAEDPLKHLPAAKL